ncbi:MAG: hypothetical protein ACXWCG_00415 [Flavitalea sp.]
MKTPFYSLCLTTVFLIAICMKVQSQSNHNTKHPRWVSDKGFWQVETNIHTPFKSTIYFYNNEKTMIYKENVEGVILDLSKKRVKIRLRKALESAVLTWNKNHVTQKDGQLISMLFKK